MFNYGYYFDVMVLVNLLKKYCFEMFGVYYVLVYVSKVEEYFNGYIC